MPRLPGRDARGRARALLGVRAGFRERIGTRHPSITPFQQFRAADDYFVMGAGNEGYQLGSVSATRLCECRSSRDDPRFLTNADRTANHPDLETLLARIFAAEQPRDHWLRLLSDASVPCAPISNVEEVTRDPQSRSAQHDSATPDHPEFDGLIVLGSPLKSAGDTDIPSTRAPQLGESTDEVLSSVLGYDSLRLSGIAAGVVSHIELTICGAHQRRDRPKVRESCAKLLSSMGSQGVPIGKAARRTRATIRIFAPTIWERSVSAACSKKIRKLDPQRDRGRGLGMRESGRRAGPERRPHDRIAVGATGRSRGHHRRSSMRIESAGGQLRGAGNNDRRGRGRKSLAASRPHDARCDGLRESCPIPS